MATDGKVVLTDSGKRGLLSSGKVAIFDDNDECAECCEDCSTDPCTDCPDWPGDDPVVTGDHNVIVPFQYLGDWECDCFWYFVEADASNRWTLFIWWDAASETYCALFVHYDRVGRVYTYYGGDNCQCERENAEEVVICCHADTEAHTGVFTLDEVGGSGSVTVTIT